MLYRKPQSSNSDKEELPFKRNKPLAGPGSDGQLLMTGLEKKVKKWRLSREERQKMDKEHIHTNICCIIFCYNIILFYSIIYTGYTGGKCGFRGTRRSSCSLNI